MDTELNAVVVSGTGGMGKKAALEFGVECFAHPWVMGPRFAKESVILGERADAQRARELGMVNRAVPRAEVGGDSLAGHDAHTMREPRDGGIS